MVGSGARERNAKSRVVRCGVVIEVRRSQTFARHRWHVAMCGVGAKSTVQLAYAPTTSEVVHPQGATERTRNLARHDAVTGENRNGKGKNLNQMGRVAE